VADNKNAPISPSYDCSLISMTKSRKSTFRRILKNFRISVVERGAIECRRREIRVFGLVALDIRISEE